MKALVYKGPYRMDMEEIENPEANEDEIVVRVRAVGMCGSDIHGFSGKTGRRVPGMVMGHEIAGEVHAVKTGVRGFEIGARVVVQPILYCGACDMCRIRETSVCLDKRMVGVNMGLTGGLSEYIAVPKRNLFSVPAAMPFAYGALVEPFAVGVGAVRRSAIRKGDTVVIVGSGVIGLTILVAVFREKPRKVYVVDQIERKLDMAKEIGAVPIDFTKEDPVESVLSQTDGKGADIAFEAVGISQSVKTAMAVTKTGGSVVWVGNAQRMIEVDMQDVVVGQKTIQGVYCYNDEDFRTAIEIVENETSLASRFVEREVSFHDATALFERLARGEEELLRAVVVFDLKQ
ncbi:MAG: alcohol dehydrogenase catalytic domain-containing protein [Spirochaetes bacterium]|nr:alcohol dehydrogenase catalytic domain-containing protein [Spirochaetota bacterium]